MNAARALPASDPTFSDEDFARLAGVVEHHLGLHLPPAKRSLVQQRLRTPLQRHGYRDVGDFVARALAATPSRETLDLLANALTTNHTAFWREPEHFVHYRDQVLPTLLSARAATRDLRVWCAAAATGEEPYQLAMIQADALRGRGYQAGVLATDLSERALAVARAGRYTAERLSALPAAWRERYVAFAPDGSGTIVPALRAEVTFRRLNLLNPWPFRQPFDVIFCRNVLIYFEPDLRHRVIGRLVDALAPGGVLYVSHTENVPRGRFPLRPLATSVWRKEDA